MLTKHSQPYDAGSLTISRRTSLQVRDTRVEGLVLAGTKMPERMKGRRIGLARFPRDQPIAAGDM